MKRFHWRRTDGSIFIVKERAVLGAFTSLLILAVLSLSGYMLYGVLTSQAQVALWERWGVAALIIVVSIALCSFYLLRLVQERNVVISMAGDVVIINDKRYAMGSLLCIEFVNIRGDNATRTFRVRLRLADGRAIVLVYYGDQRNAESLSSELSNMLEIPLRRIETMWGF